MKLLIVIAIMLGPLSLTAQINSNSTPFVKPAIDTVVSKSMPHMKEALNLTEEQAKKIQHLTTENMKARSNFPAGMTRSERNAEMQRLQQDYEARIKEILTTQQYKVYISEMEERRKKYEKRREEVKPGAIKG